MRENSEGEYAGQGGRSHAGQPWEIATETSVFTRHAVERIMRFAFETARGRPRKKLTIVTKSNAQRNGMVMWDEVAMEVAKEFGDVSVDKMLVDAMTARMVLNPGSIDTVVASNLVCPCSTESRHLLFAGFTDPLVSTLIFSPISRRHWRGVLVSPQRRISIPPDRIRVCLSQSTAQRLILLAKGLRIPWVRFGRPPR